jgi:hypothetical protein
MLTRLVLTASSVSFRGFLDPNYKPANVVNLQQEIQFRIGAANEKLLEEGPSLSSCCSEAFFTPPPRVLLCCTQCSGESNKDVCTLSVPAVLPYTNALMRFVLFEI